MFEMFKLNPSTNLKEFSLMITFLAHVSHCYVDELKSFPADLINILKSYSTVIHPEVRTSICKALVLLRNKSLLSATDLLCTFFDLFLCQDKGLRGFLKYQIVNDVKTIVQKERDMKKNAIVQSFVFNKLRESSMAMGKAAIDVMVSLYRKNVWNDAKTVNKIAECCFSKHTKIAVSALSFFIGRPDKEENDEDGEKKDSDSESDDDKDKTKAIRQMLSSNKVNKKTRKRKKMLEKTTKVMNADQRKNKAQQFNFSALHLIYDPQEMAERLLRQLEKSTERYEVKLMMMDLISRLIGVHQLMLLNFYSFIQRYLQPHQQDVTRILLFVSQASHELVLPDVLETLIKHIAFNFITERNSPECMAVGLNTVREICARCPLAMPQDLLHDFADYKNYNNKNVSMASKSIIQLFRVTNPALLKNRDRGPKTIAAAELEVKAFGESGAKDFLPGAELLPMEKEDEQPEPEEERHKADVKAQQNDDDNGSILDLDSDAWETEDDEDHNEDSDDEANDDNDNETEEEKDCTKPNAPITSSANKDKFKTKQQKKSALRRSTQPKQTKEKEQQESIEAVKERAATVSSMRILDQEEFEKLRAIRLAKQVKASKSVNTKRKNEETLLESDLLQRKELVSLSSIERLYKRPKMSKEERAACGEDTPKGRKRLGRGEWRQNQKASKTEKERQRNKAFMMIKHKANRKKKNSFRSKQLQVRTALVKQLKAKKL